MNRGFISIHRQLLDKGYYQDSEYVHLWVHLLMKCNHKPKEFLFNGKIQKIKRGQFITGRKALSSETGIHRSKIERILKTFESEHQIEQQKTNKFRLITVKNYNKFQIGEQQIEQQVSNKRATNEQPVSTNNNDNNNNNDNKSITNVIEGKPSYGDKDINWVMKEFEEEFGIPSQGSKKNDRYCAKHLLNNYDKNEITWMMKYCVTQEYAPNVGSVEKLWYKRADIIAGLRKLKKTKSSKKTTIDLDKI